MIRDSSSTIGNISSSNCWPHYGATGYATIYPSSKPELQKTVTDLGSSYAIYFDKSFNTKEELLKAIEALTERAKSL